MPDEPMRTPLEGAEPIPQESQAAPEEPPAEDDRRVVAYDFQQKQRWSAAETQALNTLHEVLARNLTLALGSYLRIAVECSVTGVEQVVYREVISEIPQLSYLMAIRCSSDEQCGLLQMDLSLAMPIIDLLLGGEGAEENNVRSLTEVEEQVLQRAVEIICRELDVSWQAVDTRFVPQESKRHADLAKIMPAEERTLTAKLELVFGEVRGNVWLVFPGSLCHVLMRRLDDDVDYQPHQGMQTNPRMRELMLDAQFRLDLSFTDVMIPASELVQLTAGQVLRLGRGVQQPATVTVAGVPLFLGQAARTGTTRAAQIISETRQDP